MKVESQLENARQLSRREEVSKAAIDTAVKVKRKEEGKRKEERKKEKRKGRKDPLLSSLSKRGVTCR